MPYPSGVQIATLTFSNPLTFLGNEATKSEMTVQPTASVVWSATGTPIDAFTEVVSPGAGLPGSLTVPFVDQDGFTDQSGNSFKNWAYVLTRKTTYGNGKPEIVKKAWQPVLGQTTVDFDNLQGGSVGLPVSAPIVPVTSVAGLTSAVSAQDLANSLEPYLPDGVTPETVEANLPERLSATELSATILNQVAAPIEAASGTFGVSDFVNSWWCAPRSIYNDLRKTIYQGGVDAQGRIELAKIDLRRKRVTKVRFGAYEVDDHNVPALLVEDDKPPVVAIVRHAVESVVRVRIGALPHDVESLETATEQLVAFPGACTYAHLHRRPGTDTLALLTRNSDGWWLRVSRDWGTTWETAIRFHGFAYTTFNIHHGVAHYAVTGHPITTANNTIKYFKISLETGMITNAAGTVIGNLWNFTATLVSTDMTYARQSYDDDELPYNTNRTFDLLPDGSILAMQLNKNTPELGGMYGVYRRSTTSATPSASQLPTDPQRGWVWEPIVASGVPVGYYVSSYVGGMTRGANANEVYLCREESGTWYTERWTKTGSTWSKAQTLEQFTDGTKLGRPQVPWGAYGKGIYMGLNYHVYPTTNFAGYYGDQRVYETGVLSATTPVDGTAPGVPTNLQATAGNTDAVLTWTAAVDPQGNLSGYDIFKDGARIATVSGTTYTATLLNPGTSYIFKIVAVDEAGNKSASAFFPTVTPTAPLARDQILVDSGSLVLIDATSQFGAWSAGVPTTTVPNLAKTMAATAAGSGTPDAFDFTVSNTLTATDGVMERTTKGGLHAIISQSTGVVNRGFNLQSEALRAYMAANPTHAYYISAWSTPTRLPATDYVPTSLTRMVGFVTSGFSDTTAVRFATGNKLTVVPSTNRTNVKESTTPAVVETPLLTNGAHTSINTAGSSPTFVFAGHPNVAGATNKGASFVLYRVYLEDLTLSGRSYATVDNIDAQLHAAAFGAGGRYAGDTHTAVSTLP